MSSDDRRRIGITMRDAKFYGDEKTKIWCYKFFPGCRTYIYEPFYSIRQKTVEQMTAVGQSG